MTRINPGMPDTIVERTPSERWTINGRTTAGVNMVVSPEVFEQYRTGYRCLRCHAVQDEPFPEVCIEASHPDGICRYPIRERQAAELAKEHRGEERYGPSPLEFDDERDEWAERNGIWLPGDAA